MTEASVSDAHIAECARDLLENSKTLLNDSRILPISKDAMESINHDVHLAFALLARRYNAQVPVNRLHPELLGMVFEHLRELSKVMDPEEFLDQALFDSYESLTHAMTVCHKWYVVASEKASLWTDIDYARGPAGPTCLLERSGTAPIHLRVILERELEDMAPFPELVRTHAFRLRRLDLYMTSANALHTAELLLGNDMPVLRALNLSDDYYRKNAILRNTPGRFPSLRGMMLMGFLWLPPSEVTPFTALTHLHISMLAETPLATITAFLATTPALEVLELHECETVTLAELPAGTTTLAHLTHLAIRRMSTKAAEVLMPALLLPAATAVHLWLDVDADAPPSDALLPHPAYWRDATRLRAEEGSYGGISIELELEGPSSESPSLPHSHPHPHPHPQRQRVSLCLEYTAADDWDGHPLWPLPVPSLATLPSVAAAHLSLFGGWRAALPRFVARLPSLAALAVEGCMADPACAAEMVSALRDALWYHNPNRDRDRDRDGEGANEDSGRGLPRLRELALVLPCAVPGLTKSLTPALRKRKRDGLQLERLRTWIAPERRDASPASEGEAGEAAAAAAAHAARGRDLGDALAEYVGAGKVEHEDGPFWARDEEVWRRENEFWEVPKTWSL